MALPLKLVVHGEEAARPEVRQRSLVEDYLDFLCAPLVGVVPYAERRQMRAEAEAHLWCLVEDREAGGMDLVEAARAALREYGEPAMVGQALADAWCRSSLPQSRLARYAGPATLRAFACLGPAALANLLSWQSISGLRDWPDHVPTLVALGVISPLVAGAAVGMMVPARPAAAVARALPVLFVHAVVAGVLALPDRSQLWFALSLGFWWLPAAALCASASASASRHFRRTRFFRLAAR